MELKDTEHALLVCEACGEKFLAPRHSHRQYCDRCLLSNWGKRVRFKEGRDEPNESRRD